MNASEPRETPAQDARTSFRHQHAVGYGDRVAGLHGAVVIG
jgi:hypothetical protein